MTPSLDNLITAGIERLKAKQQARQPPYDRATNLPPLIGHRCLIMTDDEIVANLERHFASSSRDLARNHWAHSLARHHALRQALAAERSKVHGR